MPDRPSFVDALEALEPIFHRAPPGADRRALEALVEPGFFEVGASGSVYPRDLILDVVERRYAEGSDPDDSAWTVDEFEARLVADGVVLVTYRLVFAGRSSRRATLWRRHGALWRAVYHQGTPVASDA